MNNFFSIFFQVNSLKKYTYKLKKYLILEKECYIFKITENKKHIFFLSAYKYLKIVVDK